MLWGSFPMAPWAGRIRGGRFTFDGADHQLADQPPRRPGTSPSTRHPRPRVRPPLARRDVSDTSCTCSLEFEWEFGGIVSQVVDRCTTTASCVTLTRRIDRRRLPGRGRLASVVPQARPAGVRADGDVRARRVRPPDRRRSSSRPTARGTTASSPPGRSWLHYDRPIAPLVQGRLRLRPLGRVRRTVRRHLRRAPVGPARRVQPRARTSSTRRPPRRTMTISW